MKKDENKRSTKRLSAALGLLTAGVMGFGAVSSGAWFTDEIDGGNVAADAGTLVVDLTSTSTRSLAGGFSLLNVQPSASFGPTSGLAPVDLKVNNTGSLAMKYRFHAEQGEVSTEGADLFDVINVRVFVGNGFGSCNLGNSPIYAGRLGDMLLDEELFNGGVVAAGRGHGYCFQYQVDPEAGDEYQASQADFHIVVDATQPENPGWGQTTSTTSVP